MPKRVTDADVASSRARSGVSASSADAALHGITRGSLPSIADELTIRGGAMSRTMIPEVQVTSEFLEILTARLGSYDDAARLLWTIDTITGGNPIISTEVLDRIRNIADAAQDGRVVTDLAATLTRYSNSQMAVLAVVMAVEDMCLRSGYGELVPEGGIADAVQELRNPYVVKQIIENVEYRVQAGVSNSPDAPIRNAVFKALELID